MSDWYPLCRSKDLGKRPTALRVEDLPLVAFRDAKGKPHAFLDRCPHRGLPLSMGTRRGDRLICAYHGWEFDSDGICQRIPSDAVPSTPRACMSPYELNETDGQVWVRLVAKA